MTDAIASLVLLGMIMSPGVPGELFYSNVAGEDWQEERINYVVRVVLIGMVGLAIVVLFSDLAGGPAFGYAEFSGDTLVPVGGWRVGTIYIIHLVTSAGVGLLAGKAHKWQAQKQGTIHPYAWDDLLNTHAPEHWVTVVTTDGNTYVGKIETADDYVAPEDREVLLEEPARYDEEEDAYFATEYQHLFLPADLIESVAVLSNEEDERLSQPGQKIL
jgi:hypothetical protein